MYNSIEIWKDIEGYEGMYQVSNMGRVRALDRVKPNSGGQIAKGHILPHSDNGHGIGAVGYFVHRGSSFPCPVCDDLCGYVHSIDTMVIPAHPNCVCRVEFTFKK